MSRNRVNSIPLPVAVLALSVAVCVGSAGAAGASPFHVERLAQAEQRQTLEHLLDALSAVAKELTDKLVGQSAQLERSAIRPALALQPQSLCNESTVLSAVPPLREALLNLPPPTC